MATLIQIRRGTAAEWTSANPTLAAGELALSTDLGRIKVGDGSTAWSSLLYITPLNTDHLTEGSTNLYFTNQRALDATLATIVSASAAAVASANGYTDAQISAVIDSAPGALNTLNELAAALGDDANFATTITNSIATKLSITDASATYLTQVDAATTYDVLGSASAAQSAATGYARAEIDLLDTDDIEEGSTNLYFTNQRALDATYATITSASANSLSEAQAYADALDTDDIDEGITNLYFTNTRALNATESTIASASTAAVTSANGYTDSEISSLGISASAYVDDQISSHNSDTTNVHGITDTSELATKTYADNAGVTSLSGTANEIQVSASSGAITISLPSTINADTTGNSATASVLQTSRGIFLGGDLSGSASFDGGSDITITATVADDSHNHIISNVDGLQDELNLKAPLDSPALTGTPTAPTASASANSTQIATTAFVQTNISNLINGAPGALDTLDELAAALGDDANFASTVTNSLAGKQPLDADLTAIAELSASATGFLKKDGDNSWSLDGNTYLTGNQTITLTGDVSGSGTTEITVTVADDSHNHIVSNVDGLQTALDAKLDSTSYTAADVLTKIKTVDGSTSGLDADLLDGQDGSYYLDWTNTTNKPDPTITLGGDASGSLTLTDLAGGTLTVTVADDSHNHIISNVDGLQTELDAKAPLASPALSGTPTAPTAAYDTDSTQIATTAYVQDAIERVTINTKTASYTAALGDAGETIEMNVASANNFTIPPNSSVAFPIGSTIDLIQYGAGQTTIVAGSGVTIRSKDGNLKLTGQYSGATLYKRGTDEWLVVGDLTT